MRRASSSDQLALIDDSGPPDQLALIDVPKQKKRRCAYDPVPPTITVWESLEAARIGIGVSQVCVVNEGMRWI
jgi:hypothetical protein